LKANGDIRLTISAFSTQGKAWRWRKRTVSVTSLSSSQSRIILEFPKAEPTLLNPHIRAQSAYGSFIPTPSARTSLGHLKCSSPHWPPFSFNSLPQHLRRPSHPWVEEHNSPLSSGTSTPMIPSFSRTASPPPLLPPALTSSATFHTLRPNHVRRRSNELDPILAKLERKSRLLTKEVCCATCGKVGSDYPKCGRCETMWCSRECRMVGGRRHACASRISKGQQ